MSNTNRPRLSVKPLEPVVAMSPKPGQPVHWGAMGDGIYRLLVSGDTAR